MIGNKNQETLEREILSQIGELENSILQLELEKKALMKFLTKTRKEKENNREVSRKNSVKRIMIENVVLETLQSARKAISTGQLFQSARVLDRELNSNTLRSHLIRMKARGLIESPERGFWRISRSGAQSFFD